jgi:hypothetical protein
MHGGAGSGGAVVRFWIASSLTLLAMTGFRGQGNNTRYHSAFPGSVENGRFLVPATHRIAPRGGGVKAARSAPRSGCLDAGEHGARIG